MLLGEIRARQSGKDPFGVATDLRDLMADIEPERRAELDRKLDELATDAFWGDFVQLAREMKSK